MQIERKTKAVPFFSLSLVLVFSLLFAVSCSKTRGDLAAVQQPGAVNTATRANQNNNGMQPVPFEKTLYVPCANGGAGEPVQFRGYLNFVYQIEYHETGFTLAYHENMQNVTGTGTISGQAFVASGSTHGNVSGSWNNQQWNSTMIRQMRVIRPGLQYTVKYRYHITVLANGTVTVNMLDQEIDCS